MRMEQRPGIHLYGDQKVGPIALVHLDMMYNVMFYSLSGLNAFICKLDERNKKKLGSHSDRCVSRVYGEPLDIIPPKPLPQWMVAPEFQHHSESPCSQESSDPSTPVGSGTLPSAQRPTNTDSLYGPMYTPSSIDTVYGPTMFLHLILNFDLLLSVKMFIQLLDKMRKLQFVQIRILFI